jgi:Major tropism determinant N-terminal domain
MAVRIQFRRGTAAEWTSANPTLAAGEAGYETDTFKFKLGDGTTAWTSLAYAGVNQSDIEDAVAAVIDGAPGALDTLNELAAALNDDASFANTIVASLASHTGATTNVHGIANTANLISVGQFDAHTFATTDVHGISNTALLATQSDASNAASSAVANHSADTTDVHGISNTANLVYLSQFQSEIDTLTNNKAPIADPTFSGTVSLPSTTSIGDVSATEIGYLNNVTSAIQTQLNNKANIANVEFTGSVTLPSTTSIGNVVAAEISYLEGVTSGIQTQLDGKLDSGVASTTYAALAGAEFTGNVVLAANTSIGSVSATEISYLNGVTSAVQDQLDDKAPIESPTFTGTVAGITKSMVGLGNVDNTADADKPISSATQTALDLKAALANPVFTGEVETADLTVTGNLVVQGTTTTVSANDLKLRDNMIYLNQAGSSVITAAVHGSGNTVFTTEDAHGYQAGDYVTIANTTPSSFNISGDGVEILAVTTNTFTITATTADTYTSGGTARGKVHFNPDLGWAAGRYADNTYAHAGLFRDATDGVFKFFDGYTPEPDESVFIDTAHNTFALATIGVADVQVSNAVVFADDTVQTTAGVPSITTISAKTASYTLSSLAERDTIIEISNASATTLTIPANASVAYPVGTTIDIIQTGSGQVTIANAVGVTINATPGLKLRTQWSSATLLKRAENTWLAYGDLSA